MKKPSNKNKKSPVVGMDEIIDQCALLITSIEGSAEHMSIQPKDGGVWNNIVWEIITPQKTYYFKKYRKFTKIPNYSPPNIPAEQRAMVAHLVQSAASTSFVDKYALVPSVLAIDNTAFVMEAISQKDSLFDNLSSGRCPESVISILPRALARFHNSSNLKTSFPDVLNDTRFRDYKLELQYYNTAKLLDSRTKWILEDFVNGYKLRQFCIVHGDLNSKNVLIESNGTAHVIDFEQAHLGSPAFDLAYLLSELFIASFQYSYQSALKDVCRLFTSRYFKALNGYNSVILAQEATMHFAAQVIYRFNGPSHHIWTSYVGNSQREEILKLASAFISRNPQPITTIFD